MCEGSSLTGGIQRNGLYEEEISSINQGQLLGLQWSADIMLHAAWKLFPPCSGYNINHKTLLSGHKNKSRHTRLQLCTHRPRCAHLYHSCPQRRMYNHALNKTTECKGKITKGKFRANISGTLSLSQRLCILSFNSQNIPIR